MARTNVVAFCAALVVASGTPLAADPSTEGAPSFRHEVVPILTRYGCNSGPCHGKASGQNGFRLSLRGYAPELDHAWITRDLGARRIEPASSRSSLLLRKALGQVPHGGGVVWTEGDRAVGRIAAWIGAGAPGLVADERRLDRLDVAPARRELRVGESFDLAARASWSDGCEGDVTWLARFFSNDESIATVDEHGRVLALRAGQTAVRVHFQDRVGVVLVSVPTGHQVDPSLLVERRGFIDDHVLETLGRLGVPPSPPCDDATFLRRAFLDTIGALPSAEEARAFLDDPRADKRERLVDELLTRPEFDDFWTLFLCDLLQNRRERDHDVRGTKGVRAFHAWVRAQVASRRPWDEIARAVVTARGDSVGAPEVGYFIVTVGEHRRPEESDAAAAVAQSLLGTRIGCAKCHDHPLERYTQDDYYRFAAFFSRLSLERKPPEEAATRLWSLTEEERGIIRQRDEALEKAREIAAEIDGLERRGEAGEAAVVERLARARAELREQRDRAAREEERRQQVAARPITVRQPRTGELLEPRPLDRSLLALEGGVDPRAALASWMTAPTNEAFAGNIVNRLWRHFFGVGLVEPVDDLRESNPPSHPELWRALVERFVADGFRIERLMRLILTSRVYALSSRTLPENRDDTRLYSHGYPRRLQAEVLLDAISAATGVPQRFEGYPSGMRAIQLPDPGVSSYFLGLFGRSERVTACACERAGDVTLPQLLHLQNGDSVLERIAAPAGRVARLGERWGDDDRRAVEELFLGALSRRPREAEMAAALSALADARAAGEPRDEVLRDVSWALLNTKEFAFWH